MGLLATGTSCLAEVWVMGRSLVPAFDNQPIQRDALFWEHEGNAAVRVGDWKLVRLGRNVVLARDLTDAMYDPRQPPRV